MRHEPKLVMKKDFPESKVEVDGMKDLCLPSRYEFCDILLNIPYACKDGCTLHLEIITPPGVFPDDMTAGKPEASYPAVVYCVGSAWMAQNMGRKLSRLEPFCRRGYVVVLAEYRTSAAAPFPAQIKDLKTAIRFVQEHADEYAIDGERIYVWGDSSGGHTSAMVNLTWDDPEYNDEDTPLKVRAFVDYYGPSDITAMNDEPSIQDHMAPDSPEGMLIGGRTVSRHPEWTGRVNPMNHIHKEKPLRPLLILHGTRDRLVPFGQSAALYRKMRDAGHVVEFYRVVGADHAEDLFYQEKALDIVDGFLRRY